MKLINKVLIALMIFLGSSIVNVMTGQEEEETIKSMAEFEKTTYDFGDIVQGKPVKAVFKVKNTSMVPLTIQRVKPTCGCTVADYPKDPIMPGETGKIVATYNAKGVGPFTKTVYVYTNSTDPKITLYMKGNQIKPDQAKSED